MTKLFYVYVDSRHDTQEPFYVGKGNLSRTKDFKRRNRKWHNIVAKHGVTRKIVFETQDESSALFEEARLIFELKTRDYLGGANMDDGGKGVKGYKHTLGTREILSNLSRARLNTEEERKKASEKFSHMWNRDRDRIMKTHIRGVTHHKARLTETDVIEVRKAYDVLDRGVRGAISNFLREWSERLSVTPENIFRVVNRKSWVHLL